MLGLFASAGAMAAVAAPAIAGSPGPAPFAAPFYVVQPFARPVVADYEAVGPSRVIGLRNDSLLVFRSVRVGELELVEAHALPSSPGELLAGDFDGDGRTEPLVTLPQDSAAVIYRGGQAPEVWNVPGQIVMAVVMDDPGADALGVVTVGPKVLVIAGGAIEITHDLEFSPRHLISGQFIADERADVALSHADTVTVLERKPFGGFGPSIHTDVGEYPEFLRAGRFNGDAWTDAVLMAYEFESAYVKRLTSTGTGTFSVPFGPSLPTANHIPHPPTDIVVADLDHVLPDDLIFADPCGDCESSIGVSFGNATSQRAADGGGFDRVAAGDVDGDGWADLIGTGGQTGVAYSNGGASFGQGRILSGSLRPEDLDMADVDGDGDLDVFIVSYEAEPWLLRQDGEATFTRTYVSVLELDYDTEVELADVDGEGDVDLLLSTGKVHLNDGLGEFGSGLPIVPLQEVLVLGEPSGPAGLPELLGAASGMMRVWRQTSALVFEVADSVAIGGLGQSITLLDVDGDGAREIVVVVRGPADSILVLDGQAGDLDVVHRGVLPQPFRREAYVADLNGDAFGDLVLDGGIALAGRADGALDVLHTFGSAALTVGDWDGDGLDDLARSAGSPLDILMNRNGTTLERVQRPGAGEGPRALGSADFDLDGDPDLFVALLGNGHTEDGWLAVLWNTRDDATTSVQVGEASAWREAGAVRAQWRIPEWARARVDVHRRSATSTWQVVGRVEVDAAGGIRFEDRSAGPGAYRYAVGRVGGERVGEVDLGPSASMAPGLAFVNPMPASRMRFRIEGTRGDATLELVDVGGRRVARQEVRDGESDVLLRPQRPVRPGVYFAVLRQRGVAVHRRVVVTD